MRLCRNPFSLQATYLGFANKDKVILEKEMAGKSKDIVVATDDGSYGKKGQKFRSQ